MSESAPEGIVVVDKPGGWTSHDVVGRMRRLARTRRVGHAGTLDPMATGVLVLGVGRATRLLGHLAGADKAYSATVRLGQAMTTDDAEGEPLGGAPAGDVADEALHAAVAALTGDIEQVPSSVSAIKVNGKRAYAMARAGEDVQLAARPVTVSQFTVGERRPSEDGTLLDVDVEVVCTSGTYVRALARDLGRALGVGGHLTMLRRTRVGPWTLQDARTLEQLEGSVDVLAMEAAADRAFPRRDVDAADAARLAHGGLLPALGQAPGPVAVFGPDGTFVALVEERGGRAKPLAVFAAA
ncbi:tRNA pseudouridine(55) synthase TruB [Motilibacter deserti]|uniref:tRNA pseudouridine synthase B n=1 Tax=Motilibacter deserti TaxID=2714956 RepID=A0ABX0GS45_9ACTN|nr:tRNA pseudouridine(55) synthase TruB [Motilibacter deserti]